MKTDTMKSNYHNGSRFITPAVQECYNLYNSKTIIKKPRISLTCQPSHSIINIMLLDEPIMMDHYSFQTTNGKTADIAFSPGTSTIPKNGSSSNTEATMSVISSKNSKKMPETKENAWCSKIGHWQQNGTRKSTMELCQRIEETVRIFSHRYSWESGYVHENLDPVNSSQTVSFRRYGRGPYRPLDFPTSFYGPVEEIGYQHNHMSHSYYHPNRHCPPHLPKNHTFFEPDNPVYRGSNYRMRDDGMSAKRFQDINISKNNSKLFIPAVCKKSFEKTHWFCSKAAENKVKNTRSDPPNLTETCSEVVKSTEEILPSAMSPVILDVTLPSTCKSKKDSNNNITKEPGTSSQAREATPGDLAVDLCQIPVIHQQVCKQNENDSCSDMDSGFSSEYHEHDYRDCLEPGSFSDEDKKESDDVDFLPSSTFSRFDPGPLFSNSFDPNAESTGHDSGVKSEIQLTFIEDSDKDSQNKVKNTRFDPPNLTDTCSQVVKIAKQKLLPAMSPIISEITLSPTCKSPKYSTKETDISSLTRTVTSGDLADKLRQISENFQQVCDENDSCSFVGTNSLNSSFSSSVCFVNDYYSDLETDSVSGDEEFDDCHSLSPKSPRFNKDFLFSLSIDSDVESTCFDSDSDDEPKIPRTFSKDPDNDLETVEINSCLYSRWLISPSSEDSFVFSQEEEDDDDDDDDDWDKIWSSTEPEFNPNGLYLTNEFNHPYTLKFASYCAFPKADVPTVEADDGIQQKVKEANEKWNKVYDDDDDNHHHHLNFTSKENHTPKVHFATGKKLTTLHLLVCWTYAYKAARISPWITFALDSQRFQKRIEELKPTIDPVLDPVHRQNIFTSRLQQEAEIM